MSSLVFLSDVSIDKFFFLKVGIQLATLVKPLALSEPDELELEQEHELLKLGTFLAYINHENESFDKMAVLIGQ